MRLRFLLPMAGLTLVVAPAAASADFVHTVTPGESLTSVAAADGLTVAELAAANGLPPDAELISGSTIAIPPQEVPVVSSGMTAPPPSVGDGDADGDDSVSAPAANASDETTPASIGGSYVVQPGDTLTAIAARAGMDVGDLAAANGIDPNEVLLAGRVLVLSQSGAPSPAPYPAPAVGTSLVGRMTWFGGPNDPNAQGTPASGLGWRGDGMSYYSYGSLGGRWLIHFPWGQTLPMTQIDVGPAPWTGNLFDIAFSALPDTPYGQDTWPNPTVTGTYQGP